MPIRAVTWVAFAAVLLLVACSEDKAPGPGAGPGTGPGSEPGPGPGGTGTGTGTGVTDEACKHADVVIAVDDSSSMSEEIDSIRNIVFPAFADRLLTIGAGLDDFRVAALDACPDPNNFHTRGTARECSFASGKSWMESTDPDLVGEFGCVGDIYNGDMNCSGDNDDEQPASAAAAALESAAGSGINAGFLRDDALLVVVAITDEDEQPVPGATAQEVFDRIVAIKGAVHRVVFLGIGGASSCDGVYGHARQATKLREVTSLFEAAGRGVFWDLCGGHLEDGLDRVFEVIDRACNDLPRCDEFGAGFDESCYPPPPEEPPPDPDGGAPLI